MNLQSEATQRAGQHAHLELAQADRDKLQNLSITNGSVSEGSFVKLVGFIAAGTHGPHPNTSGESVNCKLPGAANNDFHISVVERAGSDEFKSIVVEMIPHARPADWTIPKLRAIQRGRNKVLVTGALFYDNEHVINKNPRRPIGGQPKRFLLWEIHPIEKVFVCARANNACDDGRLSEWTPLVDFEIRRRPR